MELNCDVVDNGEDAVEWLKQTVRCCLNGYSYARNKWLRSYQNY